MVEASVDVGSQMSSSRSAPSALAAPTTSSMAIRGPSALTVEHGDVAVTEVGSHGGILVGHAACPAPRTATTISRSSGSQPLIFG